MSPRASELPPLICILGAGASLGSGEYGRSLRPPLTTDLFSDDYDDILSSYPLAHQAGRHIMSRIRSDDTIGLEKVLRDLRESAHAHRRQMSLATPIYLHHLLSEVSATHHHRAFRYDRLIDQVLELPQVHFVTLNYDTLLDRRLDGHGVLLDSLESYISPAKNWSLIKLHGSISWNRRTELPFVPEAPGRDIGVLPDIVDCQRPHNPMDYKVALGRAIHVYPALALPEGPDDILVLPQSHQDYIVDELAKAREINVLVIGYSGLDTEVLKLIHDSAVTVRHITIVNRSRDGADAVYERFMSAGIKAIWDDIRNEDFAHWVDDGGLADYVRGYGGPYRGSAPRASGKFDVTDG